MIRNINNYIQYPVTLLLVSIYFIIPNISIGAENIAKSKIKISNGIYYSQGNYGNDQDTELYYIPVTVKYSSYPWSLKLTVPYLKITGPSNVIVGDIVNFNQVNSKQKITSEKGLGDVLMNISYSLSPIRSLNLWLDVTGKIKFPTADEDKNLGTGKFDYSIQLDGIRPVGQLAVFSTVGYKFRSKTPKYNLRNSLYLSLGFAYKTNSKTSTGIIYNYREASSNTSKEAHELTFFTTYKLNNRWSLTAYSNTGFTDSSPDFGIGTQLNYQFK